MSQQVELRSCLPLSPWQQQVFTILSGAREGGIPTRLEPFAGPTRSFTSGGAFWNVPDKVPV